MTLQNFIVLGLIPGTHIQITFQLWLQVIAMILTVVVGRYVLRNHRRLMVFFLSLYVRHAVKERQLVQSDLALQ